MIFVILELSAGTLLGAMIYLYMAKPTKFESGIIEITPAIHIPAPAGQGQFGSKWFMESKDKKKVFKYNTIDFMTNSFKYNKNVKQSLESYEKIAGEYFKSNIEITIADMSTGNYVVALKRLDARVNSYNFSKVIRAIIQVVKGDENEQYLRNLYRESASSEYERLKKESNKKLEKVAGYSKIMLICIITIIFTMIGLMLYKNFKKIGGIY